MERELRTLLNGNGANVCQSVTTLKSWMILMILLKERILKKRKNVGGIIFGNAKESNKVSPSEDDESKSSIPDRRRTMMFDRPIVNP